MRKNSVFAEQFFIRENIQDILSAHDIPVWRHSFSSPANHVNQKRVGFTLPEIGIRKVRGGPDNRRCRPTLSISFHTVALDAIRLVNFLAMDRISRGQGPSIRKIKNPDQKSNQNSQSPPQKLNSADFSDTRHTRTPSISKTHSSHKRHHHTLIKTLVVWSILKNLKTKHVSQRPFTKQPKKRGTAETVPP